MLRLPAFEAMSLNALSIIKALFVECRWVSLASHRASLRISSLVIRTRLAVFRPSVVYANKSKKLKPERALSCLHQPGLSQAPPKKVLGKVVFPEPLVGTCHHAILLTYASSWREAHGGSCSCYANYQKVRLAGYFRYGLRLVSKVIRCFEA